MAVTIYNKQLEVFKKYYFDKFIERMITEKGNEHKALIDTLQITDVPKLLTMLVKEASVYNFIDENDFEAYIDLFFKYPDFRLRPLPKNVETILTWPDRSAKNKLYMTERFLQTSPK